MWPKFGNSSNCVREVRIKLVLSGFDQKNGFFEGWSWFKFHNLGLALGTNLKFYTSLSKLLKLKFRRFCGFNFYVCRSYRGKTSRGLFWPPSPPYWIGLICLIQFSVLEIINNYSRKISQINKEVYLAIVIKLLKDFLLIVTCWIIWFSLLCLKMWTVFKERYCKSKKTILFAILIKLVKYFIWIVTC